MTLLTVDHTFAPLAVEGALRAGGLTAAGRLLDVGEAPVGSAVNLMSEVSRLSLTWDRQDDRLPASLVAKVTSRIPENRALADLLGMYDTEQRFYAELSHTVGIRVPRCWFGRHDAETGQFVLLLEDIGRLDRIDQLDGLDAARAGGALSALGRMHARWWQSPGLTVLDWIGSGSGEAIRMFGPMMKDAFVGYAEAMEDVVSDTELALAWRFVSQYDTVLDRSADRPLTLVHRDFRVDNMHFDSLEPVVFDWGLLASGLGAYDVAYFLAGSMSPDVRRPHHDRLLQAYHQALHDDGVTEYPFADFLADLRTGALFCLITPILGGGPQLNARDEKGAALFRQMSRNLFVFIEDVDAASVLD